MASIDHENRGAWRTGIRRIFGIPYDTYQYWDDDYKSKAGYLSGEAQEAKDDQAGCRDHTRLPFCSAYGHNTVTDPYKIDFVMPSHGVPAAYYLISEKARVWYYSWGTSYSAPYLSAAALIATYAYNLGYHAKSKTSYKDPSASTLYSLLLWTASNNGFWSDKLGYGYVDLYELYHEAYDKGYQDAPSPSLKWCLLGC